MSTYYKPSNDNLDNFKDRINNYEQQPDEKVWLNIEKQLNKKPFPFKALSLIGMGVILFAVAYMIFAPSKNQTQKTLIQNEGTKVVSKNTNIKTIIDNIISLENTITKKHIVAKDIPQTPIAQIENAPIVENTTEEQSLETINEIENIIAEETSHSPLQETILESKDTLYLTDVDSPAKKIDVPTEQEPEADELFIPNAFTPGEATNNVFKPETEKQISDFEMKIFSRGGMQVFACKNINQGWDGNVKGSFAPNGVYVYIITYKDSKNKKHTQKGSLMLLR